MNTIKKMFSAKTTKTNVVPEPEPEIDLNKLNINIESKKENLIIRQNPNYYIKFKLNILLETDDEITKLYFQKLNYNDDSGFDIYTPEETVIPAKSSKIVNMKIKCEPLFNSGYYIYPRSSISKTPLRLANSVGIIDKGYRGNIMTALDNISDEDYVIKKGDRIIQLCHPSLQSMEINIVNTLSVTERNTGGFGSTNVI
jgi:dUTP pyrophosphatase